jgi:hypothetical protein
MGEIMFEKIQHQKFHWLLPSLLFSSLLFSSLLYPPFGQSMAGQAQYIEAGKIETPATILVKDSEPV